MKSCLCGAGVISEEFDLERLLDFSEHFRPNMAFRYWVRSCGPAYPALYREGRKRGNLFRGFLFLPSFLSGDLNAHVHRIGSQCP
ncbi:hypothetical protein NXX09_16945 [Bacteroides uniformis]|nr:hypothetical protein [Bacteroides uniformis]